MKVKFDSMESFWEAVKAHGVQVAYTWDLLPEDVKSQIATVSPDLAGHLKAITRVVVDREVEV